MTMFYIILLIVLGLLFLVAELVLLPGVSIGAILALVCYGSSIYLAFRDYGTVVGGVVILAILLLSLVATIISPARQDLAALFAQTEGVDSSSMPATPFDQELQVGDRGMTLSRLSPMGTVEVGGKVYEAKSLTAYVDPRREVEVVGFENFSVIVKTVKERHA